MYLNMALCGGPPLVQTPPDSHLCGDEQSQVDGQKNAADPKAGLRGIQPPGKTVMDNGKLEKADEIGQENDPVSQSHLYQHMAAPLSKHGVEIECRAHDKQRSHQLNPAQSLGGTCVEPGE